jgi:hypothetical protein
MQSLLPLVGKPFALIGKSLALIRPPVAFIGDSLTLVSDRVSFICAPRLIGGPRSPLPGARRIRCRRQLVFHDSSMTLVPAQPQRVLAAGTSVGSVIKVTQSTKAPEPRDRYRTYRS